MEMNYKKYVDYSANEKRGFLRDFAKNPEISDCIDTIADEIESILVEKSKISSTERWQAIRKYLIDGFLTYEKVYHPEKTPSSFYPPISYKELDALSLVPRLNENEHVWVQCRPDMEKKLRKDDIVLFSYSTINSNMSYVESLIRPFSLLTMMEDSLLIAKTMNLESSNFVSTQDSVDYFRERFEVATRIPASYRKFSSDIQVKADKRWKLFIQKHAEYLSSLTHIIHHGKV
jgi:hypothetical protein